MAIPRSPVFAARPDTASPEPVWETLTGMFGLPAKPTEGDRARLAVAGLPTVEGVVDYVDLPSFLGVRTDDAMYRFIHSGADRGNVVVLGHHVFAEDADEKETELAWQTWLNDLSF